MPTLTLSDPNNPAETERLRNLFWSAYLLDRQYAHVLRYSLTSLILNNPIPYLFMDRLQASTGWAGNIVDEDISQELPVRAQDFEAGVSNILSSFTKILARPFDYL